MRRAEDIGSRDRVILVTGASGFTGRRVVSELANAGFRVRGLTRGRRAAGGASVEWVSGDMRDGASLDRATGGVGAIVHLAAATADEGYSEDVNVGGARRLIAACHSQGCHRVINVSTQSVKIPRKGIYARTKAEADEVFHASGLAVTTLMPSIVYGDRTSGVFGKLIQFIQKLPVIPVLGDGRWRSAPVHIEDVARAISASLSRDESAGRRYDIGGPDQLSFDELIDKLASALGMRARKVHIPFGVSLLAARLLSALLARPPITVSNVLGSNQDTNIDIAPARRDLGFNPLPLDLGLPLVLKMPAAAPPQLGAP